MSFSDVFKNALKEKGMTQKEFSELSGISRSQISEFVNGYNSPTPERKKLIKDLLGLDISEGESSQDLSKENSLTVTEAARLLEVSPEFLRQSLIQQRVDFGWAVFMGSKWKFCIPKGRFSEFTGIEV